MFALACVQKHSLSCLIASLVYQRIAFVRRRPRRIGAALERTGSRPRRSCRNATRQALADLRGTDTVRVALWQMIATMQCTLQRALVQTSNLIDALAQETRGKFNCRSVHRSRFDAGGVYKQVSL